MGGQAYLTRLASGRSAFEPVQEDAQPTSTTTHVDGSQQYDAKGNPINPLSASQNRAQIDAKNIVLSTVGVVERKTESQNRGRSLTKAEWGAIVSYENERGVKLERWARALQATAQRWWIRGLRRRFQAGLSDVTLPMATILAREWRPTPSTNGSVYATNNFTTMVSSELLYNRIQVLTEISIGNTALKLEELVIQTNLSPPLQRSLLRCVGWASFLSTHLTALLTTPLLLHATLLDLHLYPPFHTPLSSLLPWHPTSPLQWALLAPLAASPWHHWPLILATSPLTSHVACSALARQSRARGHDDTAASCELCKTRVQRRERGGAGLGSWSRRGVDAVFDWTGLEPHSLSSSSPSRHSGSASSAPPPPPPPPPQQRHTSPSASASISPGQQDRVPTTPHEHNWSRPSTSLTAASPHFSTFALRDLGVEISSSPLETLFSRGLATAYLPSPLAFATASLAPSPHQPLSPATSSLSFSPYWTDFGAWEGGGRGVWDRSAWDWNGSAGNGWPWAMWLGKSGSCSGVQVGVDMVVCGALWARIRATRMGMMMVGLSPSLGTP